ncbi:hypothetical protein CLV45_3095 [Hymenobacter chitinivorans DSM 11115]|uniref:Uncharacterized protein n=2 Tax=Hymenobacter chitinivorans TaxID=89969 RepID=A0A2M9B9Y0_9BACT|nr:hypothetical protein CLV45_3095 [Hymenobacter chitinivorans DSM 11115]
MPLLELFRYWYAYAFAAIVYQLTIRILFPQKRPWFVYLLLGGVPLALSFAASRAQGRISQDKLASWALYTLMALVYDFLYYRYFVKVRPQPPRASAPLPS